MADPTFSRDEFFLLLGAEYPDGSAELVEAVVNGLGWAERNEFTQADVLRVVDAMVAHGRTAAADEPAGPATGPARAQRGHMDALLASLEAHALPLIRRGAQE